MASQSDMKVEEDGGGVSNTSAVAAGVDTGVSITHTSDELRVGNTVIVGVVDIGCVGCRAVASLNVSSGEAPTSTNVLQIKPKHGDAASVGEIALQGNVATDGSDGSDGSGSVPQAILTTSHDGTVSLLAVNIAVSSKYQASVASSLATLLADGGARKVVLAAGAHLSQRVLGGNHALRWHGSTSSSAAPPPPHPAGDVKVGSCDASTTSSSGMVSQLSLFLDVQGVDVEAVLVPAYRLAHKSSGKGLQDPNGEAITTLAKTITTLEPSVVPSTTPLNVTPTIAALDAFTPHVLPDNAVMYT